MFHKPDDTTEQSFHNSILVQTNQPHIETDQQYAERVANMQNFPDTNTTIQNNKSFTYISLKDLARLGDTSPAYISAVLTVPSKHFKPSIQRRLKHVVKKYNLVLEPHSTTRYNTDDLVKELNYKERVAKPNEPTYKGISISEIAHMTGYTKDYISAVLHGRRPLTAPLQKKLNSLYDAMPLVNRVDLPADMAEDLNTSSEDDLRERLVISLDAKAKQDKAKEEKPVVEDKLDELNTNISNLVASFQALLKGKE